MPVGSWSIACQHCSNYIFILDLMHGFNGPGQLQDVMNNVKVLGYGVPYIRVLMVHLPSCRLLFQPFYNEIKPSICFILLYSTAWSYHRLVPSPQPVCVCYRFCHRWLWFNPWIIISASQFPSTCGCIFPSLILMYVQLCGCDLQLDLYSFLMVRLCVHPSK